jgi:hypothetical protein
MLNVNPIQKVDATVIYINRRNQCTGQIKTTIDCSNDSFKDNLIHFIGQYNSHNNKKYRIQDVLKYAVDLHQHDDVVKMSNYDSFVLKGWKYTNDQFLWPKTFECFQDVNEIFLLYKEYNNQKSSSNSATKRNNVPNTPKKTLRSMQLH